MLPVGGTVDLGRCYEVKQICLTSDLFNLCNTLNLIDSKAVSCKNVLL